MVPASAHANARSCSSTDQSQHNKQVDLARQCQHLKHSIIWYAHSDTLSLLGFAGLIISALLRQLLAGCQDECVLHMHMIRNTSLKNK